MKKIRFEIAYEALIPNDFELQDVQTHLENLMFEATVFTISGKTMHAKRDKPISVKLIENPTDHDIFRIWADSFFSDKKNCDKLIPRADLYSEFTYNSGLAHLWNAAKFREELAQYCDQSDGVLTLNPEELKNAQGRIIRRVEKKNTEMIYVKTQGQPIKL